MDPIRKLRLAIFEAAHEQLIDKELSDNMLSFCESADMSNDEDVEMLREMTETLINISESVIEDNSDPDAESIEESAEHNVTNIKLAIFESEMTGEITKEERDELLGMLNQ